MLFPLNIPLPSITFLVGSYLLLLASMCPWTLHCCPECWTFTATSNRAPQADCQHRLFTLWLHGAIIFPIINHRSMPSIYFRQPACAAPTQSICASVWLTVFLRSRPHHPRLGGGVWSHLRGAFTTFNPLIRLPPTPPPPPAPQPPACTTAKRYPSISPHPARLRTGHHCLTTGYRLPFAPTLDVALAPQVPR